MMKHLFKQNPLLIAMLGICPIVATSQSVTGALVIAGATAFVLITSALVVSLIQRLVAKTVQFFIFMIVVATLVTIIDLLVQTFLPVTAHALGIFIPLIAVNCLVLIGVNPDASTARSVLDAVAKAVGFAIALVALALVRELFGKGTICNLPVLGLRFRTNPLSFFLMPSAGFILLGFYQALARKIFKRWS